jgi:hypothetical protein
MNSSSIPEGPGSVSGAPNLPEGFGDTFDAGQIHLVWVERQVPPCPDRYLEDPAAGLGADPLSATPEKKPFAEPDLPVILACRVVVDAADALGLT